MSIRKRVSKKAKNGYIYEVYFVYKKNGIEERYSKSGFLTKKEAQNHETEKKAELIEVGKVYKITNKSLNEVYEEFLELGGVDYSVNTVQHTKDYYRRCINELGHIPIIDINYNVLQKYFNSRSEKGIASNKCIKKALNRIFKFAIKSEYIKVNPAQLVTVVGLEIHRDTPKILEEDVFIYIISTLWNNPNFNLKAYAVAIVIAYYTGTRICETCGLLKSHFDFDKNLIYIGNELIYKGLKKKDYYITSTLKTEGSKDYVPIANDLRNILLEWFETNPYEAVICDIDGSYINPYLISNAAKNIAKKLNKHFNFHMLRHTYATNIVLNNIDLKTAQELMRHSNINTTISTYTHITEQRKIDAVNKVFKTKCVENVSKTIFNKNTLN